MNSFILEILLELTSFNIIGNSMLLDMWITILFILKYVLKI